MEWILIEFIFCRLPPAAFCGLRELSSFFLLLLLLLLRKWSSPEAPWKWPTLRSIRLVSAALSSPSTTSPMRRSPRGGAWHRLTSSEASLWRYPRFFFSLCTVAVPSVWLLWSYSTTRERERELCRAFNFESWALSVSLVSKFNPSSSSRRYLDNNYLIVRIWFDVCAWAFLSDCI